MTPSKDCVNLVKEFEGLRLNAYLCPAGKWTIGYGNTKWPDGKNVEPGQVITLDKAEELLRLELEKTGRRIPPLNLDQNQFDAVVSFVYNVGIGNFINSTLYRKIQADRNDSSIEAEFMKWTKARVKGKLKELKGLVRRRQAEKDLYFK